MKKLSLKKTTLSRLNNNDLNNVKGGNTNKDPLPEQTEDCIHQCTNLCATRWDCNSVVEACLGPDTQLIHL